MIIASKDPDIFRTQTVELTPFAGGINITPTGIPVDFETMQMRRKPGTTKIPGKYANLGISAQIHLVINQKEYLALVRQKRGDHAILKLPSGYVPLEQLSNPYLTLAQELAEECLLLQGKRFCRVDLNGQRLVQPYGEIRYHDDIVMRFNSERHNPLKFPESQIYINRQPLLGNPMLYIHKQTSSVQLVYPLRMELPEVENLSLLHAEEQFDPYSNRLNIEMNSDLWLARMNDYGIFSLNKMIRDQIKPLKIPENTTLSEVFAPKKRPRF